jgi:ubiquinone/menaquinone biosynthesis C-methylase UbiE
MPRPMKDRLEWLVFELAAGYYARKLASGPEAELRRDFADFLACPPGGRALDVGCGPGHLTRLLARRGCEAVGVDRGWRLLRIARRLAKREHLGVDFRRAPAEALPFPARSFDCVFATTVAYLVPEPAAVLAEMVRVARPGGVVATLDPAETLTLAAMRQYCGSRSLAPRDARKLLIWARAVEWIRGFTEDDLRRLFAAAGLVNTAFEPRLDGMVWFAKGFVPVSR